MRLDLWVLKIKKVRLYRLTQSFRVGRRGCKKFCLFFCFVICTKQHYTYSINTILRLYILTTRKPQEIQNPRKVKIRIVINNIKLIKNINDEIYNYWIKKRTHRNNQGLRIDHTFLDTNILNQSIVQCVQIC